MPKAATEPSKQSNTPNPLSMLKGFDYAHAPGHQATQHCKTNNGFSTRAALWDSTPIFGLCLCAHKSLLMLTHRVGAGG
jgi:hypothetical protein